MSDLSQKDLDALGVYDTPTILNALEIVAPERRATGFTVRSMHCLRPEKAAIVGYARTATIRSMAPHTGPNVKQIRTEYYNYVENGGPAPAMDGALTASARDSVDGGGHPRSQRAEEAG